MAGGYARVDEPVSGTGGRVFYGWFVVAAAFAVLFFAYGLQFSYGVFIIGLSAELGWTRAQTALPYSIYAFAYAVLSAATGRATDRFGPRPVITIGAVLMGIGWGASALVREPWHLTLTLGVVAALGMSVVWVPCNATVARWFTRRRGTAVAIASAGASLGNLIVPAVAAVLIMLWNWRLALATISIASAVLMLVAARFMVRDPEAMGLWPDGGAAAPAAEAVSGLTLAQVRWMASFWLIIAIYLITWIPVFVPFVHAAAFAKDLGLGQIAAASVLSVIGVGGIVGRLSSGVVSDRFGRLPSLLAVFALQAVSFVLFAFAQGLATLWLAALIYGFAYGGSVTLLPALCSDLYGRAHVATIVGMIFAIAAAPAAIGPYVAGWMYDVTQGYGAAFLSSAGLNLLALALALVLVRQQRGS